MHILSFDIEDWFHILDHPDTRDVEQWKGFPSRLESGVGRILDFCDAADVRATFFILGWVAETAPEVVKEIARRGHEIACHSYRHQLVYSQTRDEFERDLVEALEAIEAASGQRPMAYRAPGFSITQDCLWAFEVLAENGVEIDASVFPAPRSHGGLSSFPAGKPSVLEIDSARRLKIFPMSYATVLGQRTVFSGGGYFRLFPYRALRLGFERSDYLMTYFHPRDFDPDQPIVPGLGPGRRFKSYVGLSGAMSKLERLAAVTDFISMGEAINLCDWSAAPVVSLSEIRNAA